MFIIDTKKCKGFPDLETTHKTNNMKKIFSLSALALLAFLCGSAQTKFTTGTGQAIIFSHTPAEDISAKNNNVSGLINGTTGEIAISVPVQSFQFEKALMQEHFNSGNFMDSKQYPRITLKGKISNISGIDLSRNGKYEAAVAGDLTIRGTTKPINEKATIEVVNGKVSVACKFVVKEIGSYGVGKPKGKMKNNVSDDIEVNYTGNYEKTDN